MKLVTYVKLPIQSDSPAIKLGALWGEGVVIDLAVAQTWAQGVHRFSARDLPPTMLKVLNRWDELQPHLAALLSLLDGQDPLTLKGAGRQPLAHRRTEVILLPPLANLISLRLFDGFERHARNRCRLASKPVPPAWYLAPVFTYGNPYTITGPEQAQALPAGLTELDYSLQVACIIGREGRDIPSEAAPDYIAGFTIVNDWRAYDLPGVDPGTEFGMARARDLATTLGPALITPDELADCQIEDGADLRYDLPLTVQVNGEERGVGNLKDIYWTFTRMIAHASRGITLYPGEVITSGTMPDGCLLELEDCEDWLRPGDQVTLTVERLGKLETLVIAET
jgi:fumarylacetoacetate (FAA) hydrolase